MRNKSVVTFLPFVILMIVNFSAAAVAEVPQGQAILTETTLQGVPPEIKSILDRKILSLNVVSAPEEAKEVGVVLKRTRGKERNLVQQSMEQLYRFGLPDDRGSIEGEVSIKTNAMVGSSKDSPPPAFDSSWKVSREYFSSKRSPRLFQEVIAARAPTVLEGFTFFTTRWSESSEEDLVEEESPLIKSKRRLTETNRSDLILNIGLSLNDFFLVGLNPAKISLQEVSVVDALMPMPQVGSKTKIKEDCFSISSPVVAMDAGALPVANLRVMRVEYHSLEPFTLYPSGVLYLDPLYKTPLMHMQFDQTARLVRAAWYYVQVIPSSSMGGDERREFYPSREVVLNLKDKQIITMEYNNLTVCGSGL